MKITLTGAIRDIGVFNMGSKNKFVSFEAQLDNEVGITFMKAHDVKMILMKNVLSQSSLFTVRETEVELLHVSTDNKDMPASKGR